MEWLSRPKPPTAVFCADDQRVPDVYRTLAELGKRIPQDISVLGRGNLPMGATLSPALTPFAIQPFEMGRKAAEMLIHVIQKRQRGVSRICLDAPLIKRDSA